MTTEYILGSNPIWVSSYNGAKFLANGTLTTYRDTARSEKKAAYQEATGTHPWTNPIHLDASGSVTGPIYWSDDEPYYLEWRDEDGNLIRSVDHYTPPTTGTSPPITQYVDFENFIQNGDFQYWYQQEFSGDAIEPYTEIDIAPSWKFVRTDLAVIDGVEFNELLVGQTEILEGNPKYYVRLKSLVGSPTPTDKGLVQRFKNVSQFSNTSVSFAFQGRSPNGDSVSLYMKQNFGTGGSPSLPVENLVANWILSGTFNKQIHTNYQLPSIAGKTLGTNGDDYLEIRIAPPGLTSYDMDITNVQINVGQIAIPYEYLTYEFGAQKKNALLLPEPAQDPSVDEGFSITRTSREALSWVSPIPVGSSMWWWNEDFVPDGYFICDGSIKLNWKYWRLYQVLGKTFGKGGTEGEKTGPALFITNLDNGLVGPPIDVSTGWTFHQVDPGGPEHGAVFSVTAYATISGGESFTFFTPNEDFLFVKVWFDLNLTSERPNMVGYEEVKVNIDGTETDEELRLKLLDALNPMFYRLPDIRGHFIRAKDDGAEIDPDASERINRGDGTVGDHVGTLQGDGIRSHSHDINPSYLHGGPGSFHLSGGSGEGSKNTTEPFGSGGDTRGVNIYGIQIIKY